MDTLLEGFAQSIRDRGQAQRTLEMYVSIVKDFLAFAGARATGWPWPEGDSYRSPRRLVP